MDFHVFISALAVLLVSSQVYAEANKYKLGDHVEVYVNKVGPYWNPVSHSAMIKIFAFFLHIVL